MVFTHEFSYVRQSISCSYHLTKCRLFEWFHYQYIALEFELNFFNYKCGQVFESRAFEFRKCITKISYKNGFEYKYLKKYKSRVMTICKYSKSKNHMWQILLRVSEISTSRVFCDHKSSYICCTSFLLCKIDEKSTKNYHNFLI